MELELEKTLLYLTNLDNCPKSYLEDPHRQEFFEVVWLKNEHPLHVIAEEHYPIKGDWIYLIPPYRSHQLNKAGKKGMLLSFKRDFLEEEDKEYSLDIFKLFNLQGQYSILHLDTETAARLSRVSQLLFEEYEQKDSSFLMLRSLLKVFLLILIRIKEHAFTSQDLNQKRVYQFMMLLEEHHQRERGTEYYADKIGISTKRLNQVLREKLNKTVTQLLHDRLILEAKRKIINSEHSIKEIAYLLGFEDRPYFSRFFKKHTGLSPEDFQKQAQLYVSQMSNTLIQ
jgi:AraC-like DNA-binding protein